LQPALLAHCAVSRDKLSQESGSAPAVALETIETTAHAVAATVTPSGPHPERQILG
jgi:hypothetical protein